MSEFVVTHLTENGLYKLVVERIRERIAQAQTTLDVNPDMVAIYRAQGAKGALEEALNMPEDIIHEMENEEE